MSVLMDDININVARTLREEVSALVIEWDGEFSGLNTKHEADRKLINYKLAQLLNCQTPDFMFWSTHRSDKHGLLGVEQHVLDSLKKLTGPHGRTLYKMFLVQTFGDSDESRNDTEASST